MSPDAWTDWISITTAIHNNRRNATTKLSPNQILLGYKTTLIPTGTGESTNEATERRLETMIEKRLAAINAINHMAKARAPIPSQYKIGNQDWLEVTHLKLRHQKTKLAPQRYGPITFWGELGFLMLEFEVGRLEPNLISNFILGWDWSPGFCHMIDRIDGR